MTHRHAPDGRAGSDRARDASACSANREESPMFRDTGPGKFEVIFENNGVGVLEALLYNFDFDDFKDRQFRPLKDKHAKFLDDKVLPLLKNGDSAIWLQGSASRIGTNSWNMETSMVRAGRV